MRDVILAGIAAIVIVAIAAYVLFAVFFRVI
jgi:hypothetical protein